MRKQHGFNLIELLTTIVISMLMLNIIMQIYLTIEHNIQIQAALYQLQNDAEDVTNLMRTEIKKAGHIGCAKLTSDFPIIPYHEYSVTAFNKLRENNAHELTIRYAETSGAVLTENMRDTRNLIASLDVQFSVGDLLLISNCYRAEIFQVAKIKISKSRQEIIPSSALHDRYEKNAEISRLVINKFYLAKTHRKHVDGSFISALYLENIKHRKMELIENIEQLEFNYSLNDGSEVLVNEVRDWSEVMGVGLEWQFVTAMFKKRKKGYLYVALSR